MGSFGARDVFKCPQCGDEMRVTRRSPHSDLGGGYERQTFTCRNCRHDVERSVDSMGIRIDKLSQLAD
jgi:transcription elongation factor Elf1